MNRWTILLATFAVAACAAIGCSGGGSPVTPTPSLTLTRPNGGEEWVPGTDEEITWTSHDVTGTMFLEYSKDNFVSDAHTIATDEPNDGSFIWKDIPLDPSPTVRVRISSTENPGVSDVSDADFTIVGPWIKILTPNGGEEWAPGTDEEIIWASQYVAGTVFIEYSKVNVVLDLHSIATDEPNDGSFIWEDIPPDTSTTVRVRVSSTENPSVCDVSDARFAIAGPWIKVLTPNGGEEWISGTDEKITWASQDVTGTVFIEYSKDDFVSHVHTIAADEPNNGSFIWKDIPLDPSATARIRVSSTENANVCDVSDGDFAILGPWIEVLSPNGGEEWVPGTDEEITWASEYIIGTVDIEYSKNNFVSDINLIGADEPNDGSFIWKDIPLDPSATARVRVSSTENANVCDVSDGDFAILGPWIEVLSPNGGEEWVPGTDEEITWASEYIIGTVDIEYSKNNFVSDINLIATDEPNDGSFMWEDIPSDVSDTVRMRVSSTDIPSVNDASDDEFSIIDSGIVDFGWARTWGGSYEDYGLRVAVDGSGNVYVTGTFEGTVDFDPDGGDPHTSNGWDDVFLSKFDSSGNFKWARTWGGLYGDRGSAVAADGSGNVYITGEFLGTADFAVDFDPGSGTDYHTSTDGWTDVFLSKFDSFGYFKWARTWGGTKGEYANGVAADGSGNVYVTGYFWDTVYFDPDGGDPHTAFSASDVFLSKFDSSGNFEWARTWGNFLSDDYGHGVAADSTGNVYATGFFYGMVDFDPGGDDPHTSKGQRDIFLSKFDSSGDFEWARTWGGSDWDEGLGIAADGSGNVYVTGNFEDTVDFDPDGGDPHTSNGDCDVFLSKFDSSGNFEWAQTWGGIDYEYGIGVAIGGSGNVHVTGHFEGWVDFDPGGGDPHTSNGAGDVFLSKFDSAGGFEWARTWGGSQWDWGHGVCADGSGNVYVTGYYQYTVDFAPTEPPCNANPDEHVSNGDFDAFLTRHFPDGCW